MSSSELCPARLSLIVLVALFGFTDGSDSSKEVYGQLNSSVCLDVWDQGSKSYTEVRWFKGRNSVAKLSKNKSTPYGDFEDRAEVLQNGTLRLNSTVETDAGEYNFEIFNDEGKSVLKNKIQLRLQKKVSRPTIEHSCTSKNEVNITCKMNNVTGVSLTFANKTSSEQQQGGKRSITVKFKTSDSKKYNCTASNKISSLNVIIQATSIACSSSQESEPVDYILIAGVAGGGLLLLITVVLVTYCIRRRRPSRTRHEIVANEMLTTVKPPSVPRQQRRHGPPPPRQQYEDPNRPQPQPRPPPRKIRVERGEIAEGRGGGPRAQRGQRTERMEKGELRGQRPPY